MGMLWYVPPQRSCSQWAWENSKAPCHSVCPFRASWACSEWTLQGTVGPPFFRFHAPFSTSLRCRICQNGQMPKKRRSGLPVIPSNRWPSSVSFLRVTVEQNKPLLRLPFCLPLGHPSKHGDSGRRTLQSVISPAAAPARPRVFLSRKKPW